MAKVTGYHSYGCIIEDSVLADWRERHFPIGLAETHTHVVNYL